MVQFQVIKSTLDRLVKLLKIQTLGLQRVPENPTRTMYYPTRPEHEFWGSGKFEPVATLVATESLDTSNDPQTIIYVH